MKFRKLVSALLVLSMVLSLGATAFAAESGTDGALMAAATAQDLSLTAAAPAGNLDYGTAGTLAVTVQNTAAAGDLDISGYTLSLTGNGDLVSTGLTVPDATVLHPGDQYQANLEFTQNAPAGGTAPGSQTYSLTLNNGAAEQVKSQSVTVNFSVMAAVQTISSLAITAAGLQDPFVGQQMDLPSAVTVPADAGCTAADRGNLYAHRFNPGTVDHLGTPKAVPFQPKENEQMFYACRLTADAGHSFGDPVTATVNGKAATFVQVVDSKTVNVFLQLPAARKLLSVQAKPMGAPVATDVQNQFPLVINNSGTAPADISGYTLTWSNGSTENSSETYTFPANTVVAPGASLDAQLPFTQPGRPDLCKTEVSRTTYYIKLKKGTEVMSSCLAEVSFRALPQDQVPQVQMKITDAQGKDPGGTLYTDETYTVTLSYHNTFSSDVNITFFNGLAFVTGSASTPVDLAVTQTPSPTKSGATYEAKGTLDFTKYLAAYPKGGSHNLEGTLTHLISPDEFPPLGKASLPVTVVVGKKPVTPPADDQKLVIKGGLAAVPGELPGTEFNTVPKIETALKTALSATGKDDKTVLYDVELMETVNGGPWTPIDPASFPAEGVLVTIPYPQGTNAADYEFKVAHMFDEYVNGHKPGEIETPAVTETKDGLQFRLMGTSPLMVSYSLKHIHAFGKWIASLDGKNHQRSCACGTVETEPHQWDQGTVTKPSTQTETGVLTLTCRVCGATTTQEIPKKSSANPYPDNPKTGDSGAVGLWLTVMTLSAATAGALIFRKRRA